MKCRDVIHKISEGETLYIIAKLYAVDVREIMEQNPYVNVYSLKPGDEIIVTVKI